MGPPSTASDGSPEPVPRSGANATARSPSPHSDRSDSEDYDLYGDQDDAQSIIQPAMSPVATRLASPRTPAAEKAAALEDIPGGGLFITITSGREQPGGRQSGRTRPSSMFVTGAISSMPSSPKKLSKPQPVSPRDTNLALGQLPPSRFQRYDPPSPWQSGPKELVNGDHTRTQRASSLGESARKRLSKALDSLSIPTYLIPNISAPSFLSSSNRDENGSPSVASTKAPRLRRSMSADSRLYHSLSRVSSYGDDERFAHVREQINSRFKAIKDSWDAPSFKLPQLPNILPAPLRKQPSLSSDSSPDMPRSGFAAGANRESFSPFDAVLESLTGDIVIMGGYRGSILRSAQGHRRLWAPVKVGLNIRKVDLEVGLDPEDEENMENHIFASGMLQNIGPVDISRRLFKKLKESENARNGKLRVHDYGYDWRLSPHLLSRKLVQFLEKLPSNDPNTAPEHRGALVISHSLGGVITRHAVNQRPELFSGVIFAGAPQRCINILGPIRNGDAVMLNEKVLTAPVNFSLRTSFVFLPEDGYCFVDKHTKEEYRVDFYDVNNWIKYRLSPCIGEPAVVLPRQGAFSSLLNLPDISLRSRSNSHAKNAQTPLAGAEQTSNVFVEAARRATADFPVFKDRTLVPQLNSGASLRQQAQSSIMSGGLVPGQERHLEYLTRTLADTKRFRSELAHRPEHQEANAYPPLAVIYGKDIPTTAGAKVTSREAIPSTEAYDELFFGSGDGVVLAKEAMLPSGYELVRGGRVCTDRGHITMLGDLQAIGRAMEAVVRGRRKGIGQGTDFGKSKQPLAVPECGTGCGVGLGIESAQGMLVAT